MKLLGTAIELYGMWEVLDEREAKIIFSRYGLDGSKPKTLAAVGKEFGLTRERIRQIQNVALYKLRLYLAQASE